MTAVSELKRDSYYWARRRGESAWEIVQISTVFGEEREFWAVARIGSDLF
ncbi:hypothetical protein HGP14_28050 [Rhizobium sp. P32RR-XVIII]|nr:hypothetical protein [Rhizobium sp. P32RR-XVIII]NLS07154.1 hypothetical protein [Rhizobium sp. P32RR-XVIII]